MAWWRSNSVQITHLPSGVSVRADGRPSLHRMRDACWRMLRGKLYAKRYGPEPLVRCYEIPDGAWTTHELDGGVHIWPGRA